MKTRPFLAVQLWPNRNLNPDQNRLTSRSRRFGIPNISTPSRPLPSTVRRRQTQDFEFLSFLKMKIAILLLACLAAAVATTVKRQVAGANAFAYALPDGAQLVVSGLKLGGFSCGSRKYGYYADTDNNCRLFHVCLPILDEANKVLDTAQYSFFCGNQTVFDQQFLVCTHDGDVDCSKAASFYDSSNADFGKIPK